MGRKIFYLSSSISGAQKLRSEPDLSVTFLAQGDTGTINPFHILPLLHSVQGWITLPYILSVFIYEAHIYIRTMYFYGGYTDIARER